MASTQNNSSLRCPVCHAAFRGCAECTRCGAGLVEMMTIALEAWSMRCRARRALVDSEYAIAVEFAERALDAHATSAAHDLVLLARMVARSGSGFIGVQAGSAGSTEQGA